MLSRTSLLTLALVAFAATPFMGWTAEPARDLTQENANRTLVLNFYDAFFNKHDVSSASVIAEDYIQHNPNVPNGRKQLVDYFSGFFKENPQSRARIVRSSAENDLVYLHVHSTLTPKDRGQAVVDIFRVKNGMITEHWDVIQSVPAKAANTNTMF